MTEHKVAYGMGKAKLAAELGLNEQDANELFAAYHKAVGYVRELGQLCSEQAQRRGYVKTILGRRCRFKLFGPRGYGSRSRPLSYEEAVKTYGTGITRYFTHKAMNRIVQGSSADMVKKAMLDLYKLGHVPHATIHDELGCSVESDAQAREIVNAMVNVMPDLKVPLVVDAEIGPSWGELEPFDREE